MVNLLELKACLLTRTMSAWCVFAAMGKDLEIITFEHIPQVAEAVCIRNNYSL